MKKTVVLGISSSIAAFKTLELIKLLKRDDIEVFVIMTKHAAQMFNPVEFTKTSDNTVYTELFEKKFNYKKVLKENRVEHIELAAKADVFVIAPATANTLAKIANGLADDILTTTLLATTAPVIICPAMNVNMWNNPAVQRNLSKLRRYGYQIIEPTSGMLACGYEGKGKLEDVDVIFREIKKQLGRTESLRGKKIIVTAGGTIEKIDDVRFITNRSSGKMGMAIAEECYLRGAEVLLLRAKTAVRPRYLMKEEVFSSTEDLFELIKQSIKQYDIIFHVAAVSDFMPDEVMKGKIPSDQTLYLTLKPQAKILDEIKTLNPNIQLIAFKAEYGLSEQKLIQTARDRLRTSHADAIIANDISRKDSGFEADANEVYIITAQSDMKLSLADKSVLANQILENLSEI